MYQKNMETQQEWRGTLKNIGINVSKLKTKATLTINIECGVVDFKETVENVINVMERAFEPLNNPSTIIEIECTSVDLK